MVAMTEVIMEAIETTYIAVASEAVEVTLETVAIEATMDTVPVCSRGYRDEVSNEDYGHG